MIQICKQFWTKYADWSGVTSRKHFWISFAMIIVLRVLLFVIDMTLILFVTANTTLILSFTITCDIFIFVPYLAMSIRRFRDTGLSPLWILLGLIIPLMILLIALLPTNTFNKN